MARKDKRRVEKFHAREPRGYRTDKIMGSHEDEIQFYRNSISNELPTLTEAQVEAIRVLWMYSHPQTSTDMKFSVTQFLAMECGISDTKRLFSRLEKGGLCLF